MAGLMLVVCVPCSKYEQDMAAHRAATSPRTLHRLLPTPPMEQALLDILEERKIMNAVWTGDGDYRQVSFMMSPGKPCEDLLQQLADVGIGCRLQSVISVMPCSLCIRALEEDSTSDKQQDAAHSDSDNERKDTQDGGGTAWQRFVNSVRARLTVAQVVEGVRADAALTFDFLTLLLIASLVSALGLVEDSTVILVASVLISPLMGPVMAGTFGTVVGDQCLQKMGIMNELFGMVISMVVGFLYGLVAGCVDQEKWPTQEMIDRSEFRALWVNAVLAVASGAALSISLLGDKMAPFVGVAMSASLLPTAVNAGVLWALACADLVWPSTPAVTRGHVYSENHSIDLVIMGAISLCITFINIAFIFLTGILFLKIKEVTRRASKSQRTFWDHDIKIARDHNRSMNGEYHHSSQRLARDLSALRRGHIWQSRNSVQSLSECPPHPELLKIRAMDSLLTWSPSTGTQFLQELCPPQHAQHTNHFRLPGVHFSNYTPLVEVSGSSASRHTRFKVTPAEDPLKPCTGTC